MTDHKPSTSPLWEYINQTHMTDQSIKDLNNFKSDRVNFKFALWDPQTNGIRYLRTLIYSLSSRLSADNWKRLTRIEQRDIGNPISIRYNGENIDLDYLQAVYELEFILKHVDLRDKTILEIGAGYGRTCHAILSDQDVAAYHIIDLKPALEISRQYLGMVLSADQFSKITFISIDQLEIALPATTYDLCINIDSFAEMDPATVHYYLKMINLHCRSFYVKNPVGKYLSTNSDNAIQDQNAVSMALKTGLLQDIIDIYDQQAIEGQVEKFIAAYQPGSAWSCRANSWAVPWSYYWQAIYQKKI